MEAILQITDISAPASPRRAVRAQEGVVTQWLREQTTESRDAVPAPAPDAARVEAQTPLAASARERVRSTRHSGTAQPRRGGRCREAGAFARA
ncbi:MAG TPA: hypothetical protein VNZ62_03270 [Capillimicrobium sp.]|nr:hypothetical protein [Capillimicrobium sp.]